MSAGFQSQLSSISLCNWVVSHVMASPLVDSHVMASPLVGSHVMASPLGFPFFLCRMSVLN